MVMGMTVFSGRLMGRGLDFILWAMRIHCNFLNKGEIKEMFLKINLFGYQWRMNGREKRLKIVGPFGDSLILILHLWFQQCCSKVRKTWMKLEATILLPTGAIQGAFWRRSGKTWWPDAKGKGRIGRTQWWCTV